jgi:hypothetical protein
VRGVPAEGPAVTVDAQTALTAAGTLAATLAGLLKLALWLRSEVKEIVATANADQIKSDAFETRVRNIFTIAFAGYADPVQRAVADLESRQRSHGERLGGVEQRISALEGRTQTQRTTDGGK